MTKIVTTGVLYHISLPGELSFTPSSTGYYVLQTQSDGTKSDPVIVLLQGSTVLKYADSTEGLYETLNTDELSSGVVYTIQLNAYKNVSGTSCKFHIAKTESCDGGSSSEGTTNYNDLDNLPSIDSVPLKGNVTLAQLGAASAEALKNKVDKADDSRLLTNDEGIKLNGIESGALNEESVEQLIDNREFATKDYVDSMVGDINIILENLAQGEAE